MNSQVCLEEEVLQFQELVLVQPPEAQQAAHGGEHEVLGPLEPLLELVDEAGKKTHEHLDWSHGSGWISNQYGQVPIGLWMAYVFHVEHI
jgi:hypothetical protein